MIGASHFPDLALSQTDDTGFHIMRRFCVDGRNRHQSPRTFEGTRCLFNY